MRMFFALLCTTVFSPVVFGDGSMVQSIRHVATYEGQKIYSVHHNRPPISPGKDGDQSVALVRVICTEGTNKVIDDPQIAKGSKGALLVIVDVEAKVNKSPRDEDVISLDIDNDEIFVEYAEPAHGYRAEFLAELLADDWFENNTERVVDATDYKDGQKQQLFTFKVIHKKKPLDSQEQKK